MAVVSGGGHIELVGTSRRGAVRGAVLALSGAARDELKRAAALAAFFSDSCILVAVDGGLRSCRTARRRPDLFVGDADSARVVPRGMTSVVFPRDKDFSDLAGALVEVRRRRAQVVVVAGLLGGRIDHEWANLQEIAAHASGFAAVLAPTGKGTVLVTTRGCRAATVRRRIVSLLPLGGSAVVTLRGTKWPLVRRRLVPGSHGLSNITGSRLSLKVHRGTVALVFPADR
jgi:thiamine pyrophosphokinase